MSGVLKRSGYPEITYPPPGGVTPGVRGGRNPVEGYVRGCGLEFGKLRDQIDAHPLYAEALAVAMGRSVMSIDRLRNLFLIVVDFLDELPTRDIIEFGSYRGGSLFFFATLLKRLYPGAKVYGFDTFAGMPETDKDIDLHSAKDFSNTSLDEIKKAAKKLKLDNIVFVQGLVQDTFPQRIDATAPFGLAHIDLDIYHAIKHVQDAVWDRMTPGGYVVYDDATVSSCIGATQAVEEMIVARRVHSEQIYPHFVFRTGLS